MSKLFIGYVYSPRTGTIISNNGFHSGLAWHTDDVTLRSKFEEFGVVEEAVSISSFESRAPLTDLSGCCQGSRYRT